MFINIVFTGKLCDELPIGEYIQKDYPSPLCYSP